MATRLRVTIGQRAFLATVDRTQVTIEGVEGPWTVTARADGRWTVSHAGEPQRGVAAQTRGATWVGIGGATAEARVEAASARLTSAASALDALRPPMSAAVVRVNVAVGATIEEGDTLVVLEAMKMELPIRAPHAGVVKAVHCREGELVQPSTVLIELE